MIEPSDYAKMMLTLAVQHQREADLAAGPNSAGWHRAACDRILETLAELWECSVTCFWHDVVDAAAGGLPAPREAERLLAKLRERREER